MVFFFLVLIILVCCAFFFVYLFSYKAIRNQVNWLLIFQISGTWISSLSHQQANRIQLTHPILQASSHMKCCVAIVSLEKTNTMKKWQGQGFQDTYTDQLAYVPDYICTREKSPYLCINKRKAVGQLQKETNELQVRFFCCQM